MKKCKRCNCFKEKELFAKHVKMKDGHTNVCLECTNEYARNLYRSKSKDPIFMESERIRGREKAIRLNYFEKSRDYKKRFPEKNKAHVASQYIPKNIKTNHNHHWNYNKEYYKDVIELSPQDHKMLHSYMIYDQERMMYRNLSGLLLDSKQSHINLLEEIKNSPY